MVQEYFNKIIDAYVDIETAGSTPPIQPTQYVKPEGGQTIESGAARGTMPGGFNPWLIAGVLGVGLVAYLATR